MNYMLYKINLHFTYKIPFNFTSILILYCVTHTFHMYDLNVNCIMTGTYKGVSKSFQTESIMKSLVEKQNKGLWW